MQLMATGHLSRSGDSISIDDYAACTAAERRRSSRASSASNSSTPHWTIA
jgi:hypothetical protein